MFSSFSVVVGVGSCGLVAGLEVIWISGLQPFLQNEWGDDRSDHITDARQPDEEPGKGFSLAVVGSEGLSRVKCAHKRGIQSREGARL